MESSGRGSGAGDGEAAQIYCICRSSDVSRFMIGCEACEEWYHGDCINVTAEEAQFIKHWYCRPCRKRDPSLHIKYSKKRPATSDSAPPPTHDSQLDYQHRHKKYRPDYHSKHSGSNTADKHRSSSERVDLFRPELDSGRGSELSGEPRSQLSSLSHGVDQLLSAAAIAAQHDQEPKQEPRDASCSKHRTEGATSGSSQKHSEHHSKKQDKHDKHGHDKRKDKSLKRLLHDRKKSSRMCGQCAACTRMEDCAVCDFCKDMRKFGGPNKLRQKCRLRQCLNYGLALNALNHDELESVDVKPGAAKPVGSTLRNASSSDLPTSFSIVPERAAAAAARKLTSEMRSLDDRQFQDVPVTPVSLPSSRRHDAKHNAAAASPARNTEKQHRQIVHKSASSKDLHERKPRGRPPGHSGQSAAGHSGNVSGQQMSAADRRAAAAALNDYMADATPHQCYGPGCTEAARRGSKYCSDECGLKLANSRIFEILPVRIKQWQASPSVAEDNNRIALDKIRQRQLLAREKLIALDKRHRELETLLDRAKRATVQPEPENADAEEEAELNVFCVTCGLEVNQRASLRHMEKCFNKFESQTSFGSIYKTRIEGDSMFCDYYNAQQGTYCKRLKVLCPEHLKEPKVAEDEVCGYPLVANVFDVTGEFCRVAKRKCNKHHTWEKLRRAEIDMERLRQWMLLDDLFEQERHIRTAMANRSGLLGLLLHQTIDHDPLHPLKQLA